MVRLDADFSAKGGLSFFFAAISVLVSRMIGFRVSSPEMMLHKRSFLFFNELKFSASCESTDCKELNVSIELSRG